MFLGDDVFLKVLLCGAITLAFMAMAVLSFSGTVQYVMKILSFGGAYSQLKIDTLNTSWGQPWIMAVIMFALSAVSVTIYYAQAQANFKNVTIIAPFFTFFAWGVMDLVKHWYLISSELVDQGGAGWFPRMHRWYRSVDTEKATKAEYILFLFAHFAIFAYLTMLALALYVFNGTGITSQPYSRMRTLSTCLLGVTFITQIILWVRVQYYSHLLRRDQARELTGAALGVPISGSANLSEKLKMGASVRPVQFGPTGNKFYDATHPENRLLLELDELVRKRGASKSLSVKNYRAVNTGSNLLALAPEDANDLTRHNPISATQRVHFGLLGVHGIAAQASHASGSTVLVDDPNVGPTLRQMGQAYPSSVDKAYVSPMALDIPMTFTYHLNIMGLGVGNGTWVAIPWYFFVVLATLELSIYSQIFGDAGTAVAILFVITLPSIIVGIMGVDMGTFQLFAYNKVIGWGVLTAYKWIFPNTFIFQVANIMSDTTPWLQPDTYYSAGVSSEVQILTWIAAANVFIYQLAVILSCYSAARLHDNEVEPVAPERPKVP